MWKNSLIILITFFLLKCKTSEICSETNNSGVNKIDSNILNTKRFYFAVGTLYGNPKEIIHTSKNNHNKDITKYKFRFQKEDKYSCLYSYTNDNLLDVEYYNSNNQLDSTISSKRKTYFYNSPFDDYSPKYSIIKGKITDSIKYIFDIANKKSDYYYNNKLSSTTYYDSIGRKVRTYSYDSKFYTYFKYNNYGHLKEEYSCEENTEVKFKSISHCYEYDKFYNWVKQITEIKDKNTVEFLTITKDRKIKYN